MLRKTYLTVSVHSTVLHYVSLSRGWGFEPSSGNSVVSLSAPPPSSPHSPHAFLVFRVASSVPCPLDERTTRCPVYSRVFANEKLPQQRKRHCFGTRLLQLHRRKVAVGPPSANLLLLAFFGEIDPIVPWETRVLGEQRMHTTRRWFSISLLSGH